MTDNRISELVHKLALAGYGEVMRAGEGRYPIDKVSEAFLGILATERDDAVSALEAEREAHGVTLRERDAAYAAISLLPSPEHHRLALADAGRLSSDLAAEKEAHGVTRRAWQSACVQRDQLLRAGPQKETVCFHGRFIVDCQECGT